jgi:hypothetical protein
MLLAFATMLNSNKGTKRDMAISLIPFDRLDFSDFGYPQNGAPFSPPILGVEFRCCLAAARPRSHTLESEPERMRFAGRADSIGWTYQDDSERSSPGKRMRRRRGGANRLINCRRHPPDKGPAPRISMSHLVPLLEFNLRSNRWVRFGPCDAIEQ